MKKSKSKLGRPKFFTGLVAKNIVAVLKEHGLTNGQIVIANVGVQLKPGQPKQALSVSIPTLGLLAREAKLKLKRGRPPLAVAA